MQLRDVGWMRETKELDVTGPPPSLPLTPLHLHLPSSSEEDAPGPACLVLGRENPRRPSWLGRQSGGRLGAGGPCSAEPSLRSPCFTKGHQAGSHECVIENIRGLRRL